MIITDVRIKLVEENSERLLAFCSIVISGCFVIRDLKLIEGEKGKFVAMPSRKGRDHCPACRGNNHLRARYCNNCGGKLDDDRAPRDVNGRQLLHFDVCHPINRDCREMIRAAVVAAFIAEKERAKGKGYVCTYDDYGADHDDLYPR